MMLTKENKQEHYRNFSDLVFISLLCVRNMCDSVGAHMTVR